MAQELYQTGKMGEWAKVMDAFKRDPSIGLQTARYVSPGSGWTLFHQAAYWGNKEAVDMIFRYGGDPAIESINTKQIASKVASERGHGELAEYIESHTNGAVWKPVKDKLYMASSSKWSSSNKRKALFDMTVGYGGGEVYIEKDQEYYADDIGRVLVGWHGTWNPPRGMDGESMVSTR
eukprot:TRINITY_DN3194_c0_g2_i1.p1 TRINITY_DN3194_c0_g2~~TRINITY_DN3194_c0_g2_i1.p1  ORF type:complete len:187 (+),score=31.55 TRINITY_DN3194_c0_g2_i1:30-563(+)